jgi:hypothetical protein
MDPVAGSAAEAQGAQRIFLHWKFKSGAMEVSRPNGDARPIGAGR